MSLHPVQSNNGVHEHVATGGVTTCTCTPSSLSAHSLLQNTNPWSHIYSTAPQGPCFYPGGGICGTGEVFAARRRDVQLRGSTFRHRGCTQG